MPKFICVETKEMVFRYINPEKIIMMEPCAQDDGSMRTFITCETGTCLYVLDSVSEIKKLIAALD